MSESLGQIRVLFLLLGLGLTALVADSPQLFYFSHDDLNPPSLKEVKGKLLPADFVRQSFAANAKALELRYGGAVDELYYVPHTSEVVKILEFARKVQGEMPYTPISYDCDDFSRHFKDVILHKWAEEGNLAPLPIIEVYGSILLPSGETVYHAWNAIVTSDGKAYYIEPQITQVIKLNKVKVVTLYLVNI